MRQIIEITDDMVERFIAALELTSLDSAAFSLPEDERCRCKECLATEDQARKDVRAALVAALVPQPRAAGQPSPDRP